MKPFKGFINDWYRLYFDKSEYPDYEDNLGYVIVGKPIGHPKFSGWITTSAVVRHGTEHGEDVIETLNSTYQLGNPKCNTLETG